MKNIVASVAGRVTAIHVAPGATVQTGAEPFIIESMKMEIPVESEETGRISQIMVAVGDEVEEGQVLALLD